jgi:hypothetical protein
MLRPCLFRRHRLTSRLSRMGIHTTRLPGLRLRRFGVK